MALVKKAHKNDEQQYTKVLFKDQVDQQNVEIGQRFFVNSFSEFHLTAASEFFGFNSNDSDRLRRWKGSMSTIDHVAVVFEAKQKRENVWLGDIQFLTVSTSYTCTNGFICDRGEITHVIIDPESFGDRILPRGER